ncbi:MAG: histidine kinase, partial [Crocinitomicaceae bacterium]|nr:histidine kinase [Crocinitomicaceae bacterium]
MAEINNQFRIPIRMIKAIVLIFALVIFNALSLFNLHFSSTIVTYETVSLLLSGLTFVFLINLIQKYYHTKNVLNVPNISVILLFASLTLLINYILCSTLFISNNTYIDYLQYATPTKAIITTFFFCFALMFFWIEQQKVQESRLKKFAIEKERESLQIELNSLQQQFKPHFLFNSLNSINALTITNPEEARKMIHLLSEFMRGSMRKNNSNLVELSNELNHVQLYTDIEKVRFGSRLTVLYTVSYDAKKALLPSLILQPLIENSIKYGLYGHTEEVTIEIKAELIENNLIVTITNPFDEISSSGAKGTGYGLQSVEKKMMILYQQSNLLKVDRNNQVFSSTLKIPQ